MRGFFFASSTSIGLIEVRMKPVAWERGFVCWIFFSPPRFCRDVSYSSTSTSTGINSCKEKEVPRGIPRCFVLPGISSVCVGGGGLR